MLTILDIDADFGSVTKILFAASITLVYNMVTIVLAVNKLIVFCVINITLKENIQSIRLPIDESFFEEFSSGLFNNNFSIQLIDKQYIYLYKCYLHYVDNLLL